MNCFAHALPFLDDAYMAVGACIPDWLSALDRKCRAREKRATPFMGDEDPIISSLARGVVQHHQDDFWFHQTSAFTDLNMQFAIEVRELLNGESGFRPGLFGHVVIELMLDGYLQETFPGSLERFYDQVESVDSAQVQSVVNRFMAKQTDGLVRFIDKFKKARYIFDYVENDRLMYRVNRVLERVKLAPFENELDDWLPTARKLVYQRASQLLEKYTLKLSV